MLTITGSIDNGTSHGGSGLAAMTKGGLNAVTRVLSIEYAKSGIRVNGVAPGVTSTPMHRVEDHEMISGAHPLGRIADPSEIASAVLFLESAGFVTGERFSTIIAAAAQYLLNGAQILGMSNPSRADSPVRTPGGVAGMEAPVRAIGTNCY